MQRYYVLGRAHPYGWVWVIVGLIFWVAVMAGLVYVAVYALNHLNLRRHSDDKDSSPSPLEVAKMRFARGEINEEQYQALKKELKD